MLLICPVRPGDSNEELRFALRSWEKNLHLPRYGNPNDDTDDGLHLMTVGYCPSWLEPDTHIEGNRYASMPHAVFDNIRLASEHAAAQPYPWPSALYMNDDFFCMDPVGAVLPVRRDFTLADHIVKAGNSSGWWQKSLALTASWLAEVGFPHPWSYEAHRPLPAAPSAMFQALSRWDLASNDSVPQWRTVYGTLNEVHAYPVVDGKLGPKTPGVGTPWISTTDTSWRRYAPTIKRRFQKPSRWER